MTTPDDAQATAAPEKSKAPTRKKPLGRRIVVALLQMILGVALGLGLAEAVFHYRDDGAFPHLNVYEADAQLGARLRPGASQRVSFGGNPATAVRINAAGLRGAELPAPGSNEIIVLGDSQVFGLGVEEDATFSAQLATQRATQPGGGTVINAGIPTYGPIEYEAVAKRLLEQRHAKTVVYVVNFANDLFETERPNTTRHGVWDGWAVRKETMPAEVAQFPGRAWLYRSSHAFFAWRKWMDAQGPERDDRSFRSEGTWQDLVREGTETAAERVTRERSEHERAATLRAERKKLREDQRDVDAQLGAAVLRYGTEPDTGDYPGGVYFEEAQVLLAAAVGTPHDIVETDDGESSRSVEITAALIRRGVAFRQRIERAARLRAVREHDSEAIGAFSARDALVARSQAASAAPIAEVVAWSPLHARLVAMKRLCDAHGARLVVVALPIDVMVSPEEWRKYGKPALDMSESRVLLEDLVRDANALGVTALDATDALRAAEPGAFLDKDIHMSAKGHAALARALAATLREPPPLRRPSAGFPSGRTPVPLPEEFARTGEATVRGSTRAGCETVRVREWLRVQCLPVRRVRPTALRIVSGATLDTLALVTGDATSLTVALLPGTSLTAEFVWTDRTQRFVAIVPSGGGESELRFDEPSGPGAPLGPTDEVAAKLCECDRARQRALRVNSYGLDPRRPDQFVCDYVYGAAERACLAAHADDCAALLACARGDASAPPTCTESEAPAGASGMCRSVCDDAHPCARGACTPWNGGGVCL